MSQSEQMLSALMWGFVLHDERLYSMHPHWRHWNQSFGSIKTQQAITPWFCVSHIPAISGVWSGRASIIKKHSTKKSPLGLPGRLRSTQSNKTQLAPCLQWQSWKLRRTVNGIVWKAFHECNMIFLGLSFQREVTVIDAAYFLVIQRIFHCVSHDSVRSFSRETRSEMECLFNPGLL